MTTQDLDWSVTALDRAIAPVRRLLAWVQSDPQRRMRTAPYAYANASRWVARARALEVPEVIGSRLDSLEQHLLGLDDSSQDARRAGYAAAWQELSALDRLLGLPVPQRMPRRPVQKPVRVVGAAEPAAAPAKEKGSGEKHKVSPAAVAWSGRLDARLEELEGAGLTREAIDSLGEHSLQSIADVLHLRPTGVTVLPAAQSAGRPLEGDWAVVSGLAKLSFTVLKPDGSRTPSVLLKGKGNTHARFATTAGRDAIPMGSRVVLCGRPLAGQVAPTIDQAETIRQSPEPVLVHYGLERADQAVRSVIREIAPKWALIHESLPGLVPERIPHLRVALASLHHVEASDPDRARRRLAFEEVFLAQLGLSWNRFRGGRERGLTHAVLHNQASRLAPWGEALLDDPQQSALEDIKRDLRGASPMVRLLSGDVGAGKSGIAMMAAAMVAESRHQVLVLAPDYASAEQRFLFAEPRLQAAGITTRMVDSPNGALRDAIKRGDVQVVFGTVELLSSGLDFRRLGLVVAMERDDWGRTSALARALRPPRPDLLVVTSTPIGVSVALSAYSDHDITVVRSAPVTVRVDVHRGTGREDAYAAAAERVAAGEQALVVFPMVRGQDAFDAREAGPILRALSSEAFPDARVALFHGAASREERLETYRNFLHRRIDVLVATTHVEDMPRVPGATTVVVEQADRVPRPRLKCICAFVNGTGESHAHLVVSPKAEERTLFELSELFSQSTGAAVADAEVDMEGVSALTADDAFPAGHWTWLDPHEDRQLMLDAREAAHLLLREDPGLKRTENTRLATLARERWAKVWPDGPPCPIPEGAGSQRRRRRRRRRR